MANSCIRTLLLTTTLMVVPAMAAETSRTDGALQMVSIDVEGGGGTLFVTPEGKSLLIDTGNPENNPRTGAHSSSERIAAVAHSFGLKKIDYLITTHYHGDHVGGIANVVARIPIDTFIDHGENREFPGDRGRGPVRGPGPGPAAGTAANYARYLAVVGKHHHIVAQPGQRLSIGSMNLVFVSSDAKVIDPPLPGAGEKNPACAGMQSMALNGGEENGHSVATIISYGKVKIAALGDLTWDHEKDLFCPIDRVGKVDVFLMSHHGLAFSNSPALVHSLQPIVTVMGSSPVKGDDPDRVKSIRGNPRFQALWRLHINTAQPNRDGDHNLIANDNPDAAKDNRYNLRLSIKKDGDITVTNERNGYSKTYKAGG